MCKYTKINKDTCISCGACSAEAPEIYGEENNGIAYSLLDDNQGITKVPEEFLEDVEFAVEGCPTESVLVSDTPFQ